MKKNYALMVLAAVFVIALVFTTNATVFAGGGSDNCVVFEEPDAALMGTFKGTVHWDYGRGTNAIPITYTLKKVGNDYVLECAYNAPCGNVKGAKPYKLYKTQLISPDGDVKFYLKDGKVKVDFYGQGCDMKRA